MTTRLELPVFVIFRADLAQLKGGAQVHIVVILFLAGGKPCHDFDSETLLIPVGKPK